MATAPHHQLPSIFSGLRRAAREHQDEYGTDSKEFVMQNFYIDNGPTSLPTEEEAIDLVKRTQKMLAASNLKLHKIASNSSTVMKAFAPEDVAKDLKDLDVSMIHWALWLSSQFKEKLWSENCHPKIMIGMILSHHTKKCPGKCGKSLSWT